jgi:hypothetical protein
LPGQFHVSDEAVRLCEREVERGDPAIGPYRNCVAIRLSSTLRRRSQVPVAR